MPTRISVGLVLPGLHALTEDEDLPSIEDKIIPKKEALVMLGVSMRTFYRIKKELKEKFDMGPVLMLDQNDSLISLYSLMDVRKMLEIKALRLPGRRWPRKKEDLDA